MDKFYLFGVTISIQNVVESRRIRTRSSSVGKVTAASSTPTTAGHVKSADTTGGNLINSSTVQNVNSPEEDPV